MSEFGMIRRGTGKAPASPSRTDGQHMSHNGDHTTNMTTNTNANATNTNSTTAKAKMSNPRQRLLQRTLLVSTGRTGASRTTFGLLFLFAATCIFLWTTRGCHDSCPTANIAPANVSTYGGDGAPHVLPHYDADDIHPRHIIPKSSRFPRMVLFTLELGDCPGQKDEDEDEDEDGCDDWRDAEILSSFRILNPSEDRYPTLRKLKYRMSSSKRQDALLDSADYEDGRASTTETDDCKLQHDWQKTSIPSCNSVHELSLVTFEDPYPRLSNSDGSSMQKSTPILSLVGDGYWRDVWVARQDVPTSHAIEGHTNKYIFKSMRYEHDFDERNIDRMRRDAVVMEKLSSHKYVVDVYGVCGTSGFYEFADGGDISTKIWPDDDKDRLSQLEKLRIATQAAIGLAAVHNSDAEGVPSIAHTDITTDQFLIINGRVKINDFNRARFIAWSTANNAACPYYVGNNPGKNRSPEEYQYLGQSEKVDVYSFGNILFSLLQEETAFHHLSSKKARKQVAAGKRPQIDPLLLTSTDPVNVALRYALSRCYVQDPELRATARELEHYLKEQLEALDPGRLKKWEHEIR